MSIKKVLGTVFILFSIIFSNGCVKQESHEPFYAVKPNIEFCYEISINSDMQMIKVYYPVVTNKTITLVKGDTSGTILNFSDDAQEHSQLKVTLQSSQQDKLNILYNDLYISFVCLEIKIEGELKNYSSIDLWQTAFTVFCDKEGKSVNYDKPYFRINILPSSENQSLIDWDSETIKMLEEVKKAL